MSIETGVGQRTVRSLAVEAMLKSKIISERTERLKNSVTAGPVSEPTMEPNPDCSMRDILNFVNEKLAYIEGDINALECDFVRSEDIPGNPIPTGQVAGQLATR